MQSLSWGGRARPRESTYGGASTCFRSAVTRPSRAARSVFGLIAHFEKWHVASAVSREKRARSNATTAKSPSASRLQSIRWFGPKSRADMRGASAS
eukprot:3126114-Prymnesium_polylepis.1